MCKTEDPGNGAILQVASRRAPVYRRQGASYTLPGSPDTGAILKQFIPGSRVVAVKGLKPIVIDVLAGAHESDVQN